MDLITALKNFHLIEWYLKLTPTDKTMIRRYCPYDKDNNDSSNQNKVFHVNSSATFLWVTGANLLPHGIYLLAESCLLKALDFSPSLEDKSHIYANLAQLYYDRWTENNYNVDSGSYESNRYQFLCKHYCNKTITTGYFVNWAENMLSSLETSSIEWM